MLRVTTSNRTEELLAALLADLRSERNTLGPFEALRLVVPNRNVAEYVKIGMAEAWGIAANLEVLFLRGFLERVIEAAVPGTKALSALDLEGCLIGLFHDQELLARAIFAPVREYLCAAGSLPDAVDRRRCQLAAELARLFDEYAASRPHMLRAWPARATLAGRPGFEATEAWQRALWLAILGPAGRLNTCARGDVRRGWLIELYEAAAAEGRLGAAPLPRAVHVFGLSYVAPAYHRMLALCARHIDVRIYALHPCRELWEDFGLALEDENLALRLWGRPGREHVHLLCQSAKTDFEARFCASGARPPALLSRLQDDILDRVARREPDPSLAADASLRILPCPGPRREIEVVAAEIWALAREDPTLELRDVAVIVPESVKDVYLPHVGAVFGEAHDLPHSVVDLSVGAAHRLGDAVLRLIDLPLGRLSRRELLPLLTHPALLARFPEADAPAWLGLPDLLGIFHGADRSDHDGTYLERDLLSWDQGLKRLALGALMTGPAAGDERPVALGRDAYLPAELPPEQAEGALGFALCVRSLIEDARLAAGVTGPRERPLSEWLAFVRALLSGYLAPADEAEDALLARWLGAIDELEGVDTQGARVSYRVAAELVRRTLGGLEAARGQYLAHGVQVASFVPMRALPFRAVFVVGLGHGHFPRAPRRSELDLREARRELGDVGPREQDLYMFLETLLSARERLVLSYVARDEISGEELPPSSVLLELREILSGYLARAELAKLFSGEPRPPLRRYDDLGRLDALPPAFREHAAKRLGDSLRATLPPGVEPPDLAAWKRALAAGAASGLVELLGVPSPPPARARSPTPEREPVVVSLADIRRFLEDPLQGSARFRLRLRAVEGGEEVVDRSDEVFETRGPERTDLLRETMRRALLGSDAPPCWDAIAELFERLLLARELEGRAPSGFFREAARRDHEAVLRTWWSQIEALAAGAPFGRRVVSFGRARDREETGEVRAAIRLDLDLPPAAAGSRSPSVEIIGSTELLLEVAAGHGSLLLAADRGRAAAKQRAVRQGRRLLRAFLDHVALAAHADASGEPATGRHHHGYLVSADRGAGEVKPEPRRFRPLDAARARRYLCHVVADMLLGAPDAGGAPSGVHPYLLPCEALFAAGTQGQALVEAVEELREAYFERSSLRFSSCFGPVPQAVERHLPPPAAEAAGMAARRFGLFFELLVEGAGEP